MTDWLNKFQTGGQIDKVTKQLVGLIGKAYKEIRLGLPGKATLQLVQLMQDPLASQMLSNLAQQMPEVGQALNAIKEALGDSAQSMKKGGKADDCPCHKKLFRIGGKICQITVDCNDNIVSE